MGAGLSEATGWSTAGIGSGSMNGVGLAMVPGLTVGVVVVGGGVVVPPGLTGLTGF
jgi:hypothetical protein